jgi:cytidine deaminase
VNPPAKRASGAGGLRRNSGPNPSPPFPLYFLYISPMNWEPLVAAARTARANAYAPYSRFPVGAALAMDDGRIFAGCNVENRSYGLTICAERNALAAAVVAGSRHVVAVAVVTDSSPPAPPCGLCLQALSEFAADLPVLLTNVSGERRELKLSDLLPYPFVFHPPA